MKQFTKRRQMCPNWDGGEVDFYHLDIYMGTGDLQR